jgi:hypothetical protein
LTIAAKFRVDANTKIANFAFRTVEPRLAALFARFDLSVGAGFHVPCAETIVAEDPPDTGEPWLSTFFARIRDTILAVYWIVTGGCILGFGRKRRKEG